MLSRLAIIAILFMVWVVCSGFFSPFFLSLGALSSLFSFYVSQRLFRREKSRFELRYLWQFPVYVVWLAREIILSSIAVAKIVWKVKPAITPVLSFVPVAQETELGKTLMANSITLTPGTVTVRVLSNQMQVHALMKGNIDDLWKGNMDRHVRRAVQ